MPNFFYKQLEKRAMKGKMTKKQAFYFNLGFKHAPVRKFPENAPKRYDKWYTLGNNEGRKLYGYLVNAWS